MKTEKSFLAPGNPTSLQMIQLCSSSADKITSQCRMCFSSSKQCRRLPVRWHCKWSLWTIMQCSECRTLRFTTDRVIQSARLAQAPLKANAWHAKACIWESPTEHVRLVPLDFMMEATSASYALPTASPAATTTWPKPSNVLLASITHNFYQARVSRNTSTMLCLPIWFTSLLLAGNPLNSHRNPWLSVGGIRSLEGFQLEEAAQPSQGLSPTFKFITWSIFKSISGWSINSSMTKMSTKSLSMVSSLNRRNSTSLLPKPDGPSPINAETPTLNSRLSFHSKKSHIKVETLP